MKKTILFSLTIFIFSLGCIGYFQYRTHETEVLDDKYVLKDRSLSKYNSANVTDGILDIDNPTVEKKFFIYSLDVSDFGVTKGKIYLLKIFNENSNDEYIVNNTISNNFTSILDNKNRDFPSKFIPNSLSFIENFPNEINTESKFYTLRLKYNKDNYNGVSSFTGGYCTFKASSEIYEFVKREETVSQDLTKKLFLAFIFALIISSIFFMIRLSLKK